MKLIIIPLLCAAAIYGQTAPTAQRIFQAQTTATTAAITNRGQVAHSLTVFGNSATNLSDFDIRLEGSFDGTIWVPISADLTSAATNGTTAAATIRANGAYPRVRVNYLTASATPLSAYYVGTAVPTIEGFVFGGATGNAPANLTIASIPGLQPALNLLAPLNALQNQPIANINGLQPALDSKASLNLITPIPVGIGLLAINTANGPPQQASPAVLTSALCSLTYFSTTSLCQIPNITVTSSSTSQTATLSTSNSVGATYALTFNSQFVSGNFTPNVTGLPAGVTAGFQPAAINSGQPFSNLVLTIPTTAPVGTSTLTITGSAAGATSTPATVTLVIVAPPGSMSTAIDHPNRAIATNGTQTFNVGYNATNLTSAITPTVTGLPSGVTVTFNPATVPAGGGSTLATLTASGATAGASATLTFSGTSGAVTATNITAPLTVSPGTGTLTGTVASFTSPLAISNTAPDWRTFGDPIDFKSGGTALVNQMNCATGIGYLGSDAGSGATVSWTNGTNLTSGSTTKGMYNPNGCIMNVNIAINNTATHHFAYYTTAGGGPSNTVTHPGVNAHVSDSSSPDFTVTDTGDGQSLPGLRVTTFTVRMNAAGTLSLNGFAGQAGFLAMAIVQID